jgi:hypothetical protein
MPDVVATTDGVEGTPLAVVSRSAADAPSLEDTDPEVLLRQWVRGIRVYHIGHRRAAVIFARRARFLGVLTTLASAVVGTTIFSSLANSTDSRWIVLAGALSVGAVITSALQTFLNYGELVASHRTAATAYGGLRRKAEQVVVFTPGNALRDPMAEIATEWTKLDQDSPDLPDGIFRDAMKRADRSKT